MLTDAQLAQAGCPSSLYPAARRFHREAVERFGGTQKAEVYALEALTECCDDSLTVIADGSCFDTLGELRGIDRAFAALVAGHVGTEATITADFVAERGT